MRFIFIFIDGVGIAPPAPDNPIAPDACPFLCDLIANHCKPIDACLGVEGLPQSATGQATLFTGRNAAAFMGRHVEGFPGPTLRRFVEQGNIFTMLKDAGLRGRFADGYVAETVEEIRARRFRSVTTTAALTVPEVISLKADLMADHAVLHDLTRSSIVAKGYDGPLVTPEQAAEHLFQIALGYDYTLFEYFLTDRAGHSGDIEAARSVLRSLDAFLSTLFPLALAHDMSIAMSSDHGNIESISAKGHTRNPVPLIACGKCADPLLSGATSLADVTPAIIKLLATDQANGLK